MPRLAGKVALVTGAAGVLGAAQAQALAEEGAVTIVSDLAVEAGEAVAAGIRKSGFKAEFLKLDAVSATDWAQVVAEIERRHGALHVLVNNAGINPSPGTIETRSEEEWDRVMAVNAKSVFLGTRQAIPAMRRAGGGAIVNISSVAGLGCSKTMEATYAASKAAVFMFTKTTAAQYGHEGIRCNTVHPGPIDSDMLRRHYSSAELKAQRLAQVPLGRFGQPREVAMAVVYLASDEAAYTTGAQLVVDGGALVQ